jgi:hypothetical protein
MEALLWLFTGSGLLLSALSIPLILRKIKPNGLYGFRVKATLEAPTLWYAVNAYSDWRLLAAGLCIILAAVGLYLVPGLSLDGYALACLGVFAVVFWVGLVQSIRYMRRF